MNFEIAKSTGFTVVQSSQGFYSEVMHKVLPNPTEDTSRSGFSYSDKKDRRIKELIKKASVAYTVDAMVRQSVDKFSEMFKSFDFEGGEAQVKYLKERLTQMTLQTGEHWETLITRIVHEYFKTGNSFIVKRRGGNPISSKRALYKNKPYTISGLSLISADRLEVTRNKLGEFVGWEISGTKNDDNVRLVLPSAYKHNPEQGLIQITKLPDEKNVLAPGLDIVQIAYKKGADSNFGFGLVLAALEDISMTRTLEQITAVMMKKFSNPIIHHKILRPSSPLAGMQQEINMAYDLYRRMAPDGVLITGGNAEIKAIGSESQALRVEGYLKYFLHRSLAGLGISPYIVGLEGGGQGTLEASVELMMMKVRFCQAEIARELEMFVLNELLWEGGFDPYNNVDDQVRLVFEDIDENRTIKLQTHAADMFQKNMWGHQEARRKGGTKETPDDNDLYLNKVDIPKTRAEAEAKGTAQKDAGVAIAKARPKPAAPKKKKKAKEVLEDIQDIIPENESQLMMFMNIMEKKCQYDSSVLEELYEPVKRLLGDSEAIEYLLVERLSDNENLN
jgi:hypothetical protein